MWTACLAILIREITALEEQERKVAMARRHQRKDEMPANHYRNYRNRSGAGSVLQPRRSYRSDASWVRLRTFNIDTRSTTSSGSSFTESLLSA